VCGLTGRGRAHEEGAAREASEHALGTRIHHCRMKDLAVEVMDGRHGSSVPSCSRANYLAWRREGGMREQHACVGCRETLASAAHKKSACASASDTEHSSLL
jgi:hypothetical protein